MHADDFIYVVTHGYEIVRIARIDLRPGMLWFTTREEAVAFVLRSAV